MAKWLLLSCATGCLMLAGCGSETTPDADGEASTPIALDGKLAAFKNWNSADGPQRLAIIEQAMDEKKHVRWLENFFVGRPVGDLKQVLGEPDLAEERTRTIATTEKTNLYYFYYLGTTTQDTPEEDQDLLEFRTDTLKGTLRVHNLQLRLKRFNE